MGIERRNSPFWRGLCPDGAKIEPLGRRHLEGRLAKDVSIKQMGEPARPEKGGPIRRPSGPRRKVGGASTASSPLVVDVRRVLVVVGNGMVSQRFCERAIELGLHREHRIIVFGEEPLPAYDRVQLTSLLEGRDTASLIIKPMLWYVDHDIDLRVAERVVAFDPDQRTLTTQLGDVQHYDQLVFATGSVPAVPAILGIHHPGIHVYRTADDVKRIGQRASALARDGDRVVVIGSGLLGVEAGQALQALGCSVTLVEAAEHMLPRQLDRASAQVVQDMLVAASFDLRVGQIVDRIEVLPPSRSPRVQAIGRYAGAEAGAKLCVELRRAKPTLTAAGGRASEAPEATTRIHCGMVVLAAGVRPRDELAKGAGISCAAAGGIEVDDALRTSDERVFAIGECARYAGKSYGLIAPGYAMADVLAERLAGKKSTFSGVELNTRLKVKEVELVIVGESAGAGVDVEALVKRGPDASYRRLVLRKGRLVGATAIGAWPELPMLQEAIVTHAKLEGPQRKRFSRDGSLWRKLQQVSLKDWPDAATVCACTGVSYGVLCRAREQGCNTVDKLSERTRAATVCGTCRPLLDAFVKGNTWVPAPRLRLGLGVFALAALALTGAGLYHGPIPLLDSVQGTFRFDVLWRNHLAKQISGFVLLGLCALAAGIIALGKRWRKPGRIDFASSRTAHAVLGALALVGAGVHTGLRLGRGLDFVLMSSLLATMVLGATTALLVAGDGHLMSPTAQRLRRWGVRLHLLLTWPIPVLVLFHVLKSYFF